MLMILIFEDILGFIAPKKIDFSKNFRKIINHGMESRTLYTH